MSSISLHPILRANGQYGRYGNSKCCKGAKNEITFGNNCHDFETKSDYFEATSHDPEANVMTLEQPFVLSEATSYDFNARSKT